METIGWKGQKETLSMSAVAQTQCSLDEIFLLPVLCLSPLGLVTAWLQSNYDRKHVVSNQGKTGSSAS